jgi:hypothetical protein
MITAGLYAVSIGGPYMGLAERVAAIAGFQWTLTLAFWLFSLKTGGR